MRTVSATLLTCVASAELTSLWAWQDDLKPRSSVAESFEELWGLEGKPEHKPEDKQ